MKTNSSTNHLFWAITMALAIFVAGCKNDPEIDIDDSASLAASYDAKVPYEWNGLFLEIDRFSPGYRPPAAARMLAYTGLAAYEAAVNGMPKFNSMEPSFPGLPLPDIDPSKEYHWPAAVNAAYGEMFRYFYPHVDQRFITQINALENKLQSEFTGKTSLEVISRSIVYGKAVAQAVTRWSETDTEGHEAFRRPRPASYNPPVEGPNGEQLWQPTFPDYTRALFPYWGQVRAFALREEDKIARPPLPWSEDPYSQFYNQAKEVKLWVDNATEEDRWIAEFWSDDIFELTFEPAGRLVALANQMVAEEKVSLEQAVELYAKMGMALCDVGIAVWHSKYLYNVERPVQYIRRVIDPNWKTILNNPIANVIGMSPEFPAYPSGHSGFGGAGGAILTHIFGTHALTDRCHEKRTEFLGMPRSFNNPIEAGVENAYSRLPLGVHYRMDCDEGLRMGYLAAQRVTQLPWKKR